MDKITKKPESPCLDCPDRSEACHAKCERYAAFVKENEVYRAHVNAEHNIDAYLQDRHTKIVEYLL